MNESFEGLGFGHNFSLDSAMSDFLGFKIC